MTTRFRDWVDDFLTALTGANVDVSADKIPIIDDSADATKYITPAELVRETGLSASSGSSLVGFVQPGTGAVARTMQAKGRDIVSVQDFGAVADGNYGTGTGTDNSPFVQAAIDALSITGGGIVFVPGGILGQANSSYKLASQITVPSGVSLVGLGKWSSIFFAPTAFANAGGLIRLNGVGGNPTNLSGVGVIAQTGGAGGYGIVSVANGTFLRDLWVNGFTSGAGVRLESTDNFLSDFTIELCSHGLQCLESHQNISHGVLFGNTGTSALISNNASVDAGPVIFNSVRATGASPMGFQVSGGKNVIFNGCSATHDNNAGLATKAFSAEASSSNVIFNGCIAKILGAVSATGLGFHVSASDNIALNGNTATGFDIGLKIQGGSTKVQLGLNILLGNTTDLSILDGSSEVRMGPNTFATFAEATPASIASATALTLPVGPDQIIVTGTTTITSIVATGQARRTVTLQFTGILTFTAGSNLKLAGNFVTSADDTITLYCDGTNWFELARSVNA